jgi:hypothetical protein
VVISLERGGSIRYTFRHRAMFAAGIMSAAVVQDVVEAHPRDDWRIASWYTEDQITCSKQS